MLRGGTSGAGGVKNFSVGICDGAPSTARSSHTFVSLVVWLISWNYHTFVSLVVWLMVLELDNFVTLVVRRLISEMA